MTDTISGPLEEATARIETILHIGAMTTDGDCLPTALEDMLQDQDTDDLKRLFPGMPARVMETFDEGEPSEFVEWVYRHKRLGFLVLFATPVMKHISEGHCSYSWGHYGTRWVYADTLDDALQQGLAWVAERRAKEKEAVAA
jgi:hypothetical protein